MAEREALHLMAMPGPQQQDLGWKDLVIPNPTVWQSCGGPSPIGRRHRGSNRYRLGGVLSTTVCPYRKGQGGNGNRPQDCRSVLQRFAARNGLCGPRCVLLRSSVSGTCDRQSSPSCQSLRLRPADNHIRCCTTRRFL